ncbi:acyl-CoA N-acyltransferase [Zalerion maritima]|uniref:Acyl-CoA N-acyltransferase n=1 Tax=Zalerion maritima TaxID=339359 RepID=A0AAD5RXT0_9PEZI|nr:acyl-CoA N-acyltransferase [Zalerion maritima]
MTVSSTLRIRRAVEADAKDMSDTYFDAFDDTVICMRCFPLEGPTTKPWFEKFLLEGMRGEAAKVWVVVDTALPGPEGRESEGKVVAFAKWVGPRSEGVPKEDEGGDEPCPPGGDMDLAREFFKAMHEAHVDIMGGERHWFLSLIGTRKEAQGRGAAGMLIREGLRHADEAGLRCFLDATQKGKPIYKRFGFREVRCMTFADESVRQDCMVREPQGNR